MITTRSTLVAAALALAVGTAISVLSAATPGTPPTSATATAATKVGSVSGTVVDKDGKPAASAMIRYAPVVAGSMPAGGAMGAGGGAAGGGRGGRGAAGGRGGRGMGNATSNDKGEFTLTDVPVGQVNITATLTAADGTRQRGTTTAPVDVKEKAETKLTDPIKLADAPAGRGGGAGGGGGGRGGAGGGAAATAPAN